MTCVDKTSKRPKYCVTESTVDVPEVAKEFFDTIVRHHGLPAVIISDRGSKFTSQFWQELMKIMGVKHFMTTAGRAQKHLGTIEYAHQGLIQASTGLIPFEVDTGRKLRNPVLNQVETLNEYAKNFSEQRKALVKMALENLDKAQTHPKSYYDKKRSKLEFREGEFVMLATRNVPIKHAKLVNKDEKPWLLELPKSMKRLHNVFNVDRLKKCPGQTDRFTNRPIPKVTAMLLDDSGHEVFIVDKLLKQRQFNRKKEYLVKWHGFAEYEATWELEQDIKHVSHFKRLVQDLRGKIQEAKSITGGECSDVTPVAS
ncbi:hypothetical protein AaE_015137 [Aphanomyces astaci]|uniref:Chromo domain-containing protein n=1 Tax=Aphanomyces astaci TaxID=112090 RepID=A0A6A4Z3Q4_APHAT|nr:hypothetical protein AaE_015137 [Aphanomyces astaci]